MDEGPSRPVARRSAAATGVLLGNSTERVMAVIQPGRGDVGS